MKISELIVKLQEAQNELGDKNIELSIDSEGTAIKVIDEVAYDNVGDVIIIYPIKE